MSFAVVLATSSRSKPLQIFYVSTLNKVLSLLLSASQITECTVIIIMVGLIGLYHNKQFFNRTHRKMLKLSEETKGTEGFFVWLNKFLWQIFCNEKLTFYVAVNGGVSEWSAWSACRRCGKSTRKRTRKCNTPSPANDGKPCVEPLVEERNCPVKRCRCKWLYVYESTPRI